MVKVSIYKSKMQKEEPVQVKESLPSAALDELILALCFNGFIEEDILNPKTDTMRIAVTTHLLGPVPTPYLLVFEGTLENGMSTLGTVSEWFVKATHSASEEVLEKILS